MFEGFRLLEDAISTGFIPVEVLLSESRAASAQGQSLLKLLAEHPGADGNVVRPQCVDDDLLRSLSETVNSQAVFALFRVPLIESDEAIDEYFKRRMQKTAELDRPVDPPLLLLCDNLADPGNLGTLIRSSAGFGASAVIAIAGCDPWVS